MIQPGSGVGVRSERDVRASVLSRPGVWLCLVGGALFLLSLPLPAVDNSLGDFARGFGVRGYQCAVGLIAMPLVVPLATPLWLALLAGNLWAIGAPWLVLFRRASPSLFVRARWLTLLSVAALLVLTALRDELGLSAIHSGYVVWAASLVLVCVGAWIPGDQRLRRREWMPFASLAKKQL